MTQKILSVKETIHNSWCSIPGTVNYNEIVARWRRLTIVLGRDSNSVTQSLSSKSIWRRGWSRISLPIHRVTVSLFTLSLSLFLSLGSFLLFDEARWRSVVEFSPSINAANPCLIRDRSWNRPTLSTLAISSRFSKNLITLLVSLKIRCSNLK